MIPKFDVEIKRKVNLRLIRWPPEKVLTTTSETGFLANNHYEDMRGFGWKDFLAAYKSERRIIEEVDGRSRTHKKFETMLEEISDDQHRIEELGEFEFDIGVNSATIAVSACGCAPVSSCRGHILNGKRPYIAFWAKRETAEHITKLVTRKDLGIENVDLEGYGGLRVYSSNVLLMMSFGKTLYNYFGRRR